MNMFLLLNYNAKTNVSPLSLLTVSLYSECEYLLVLRRT